VFVAVVGGGVVVVIDVIAFIVVDVFVVV
jgi:hypothetical protein